MHADAYELQGRHFDSSVMFRIALENFGSLLPPEAEVSVIWSFPGLFLSLESIEGLSSHHSARQSIVKSLQLVAFRWTAFPQDSSIELS